MRFWNQIRLVQILALPLISYKFLRKLPYFSGSPFLIYKTGLTINSYIVVRIKLSGNIKGLVHRGCYFLHFVLFSHCVLENHEEVFYFF